MPDASSDGRIPSEARMREFVVALKRWAASVAKAHRYDVAVSRYLAGETAYDDAAMGGNAHAPMARLETALWKALDDDEFRVPWGWPDAVADLLDAMRRPGTTYHCSEFRDPEAGTTDFGRAARRVADIEARVTAFAAAVAAPAPEAAAAPPEAEPTPEAAPPKPKRTGRPLDTDRRGDARVSAAWEHGSYATFADCARALGMKPRDVRLAVDRERKRRKKSAPAE